MNPTHRKRAKFQPSLADATLEQRMVLSSGGAGTAIPAAPPAAPAPESPTVVRRDVIDHLRADLGRQFRASSAELRKVLDAEIRQTYSHGSTPTASQLANLNATTAGAIDATALVLASEAARISGSNTGLVSTVANVVVGSGQNSLANRLASAIQSPNATASAQTLQSAVATEIQRATAQNFASERAFFAAGGASFSQIISIGPGTVTTRATTSSTTSTTTSTTATAASPFTITTFATGTGGTFVVGPGSSTIFTAAPQANSYAFGAGFTAIITAAQQAGGAAATATGGVTILGV
jgi:hypothetical protein